MLEEFLSGRSTKAAASHTANAKIDLDDMDPEPPMHQEGKAELLSALERNANSPTKQELQMRSMLLEQQNKKRILMARQEQSHPYHPPTSSRTPMPAAKPRVSVDVFGCDSPPRQLSCQPPNIQEMNGWLQSPLSSEQMQLIQKQQIEVETRLPACSVTRKG